MNSRSGWAGLLFLVGVAGCGLKDPVSPSEGGYSPSPVPTPVPGQMANAVVTGVYNCCGSFSTWAAIDATLKEMTGLRVTFTNYQVQYSYDAVNYLPNLARLVNPLTVSLNQDNSFRSNAHFNVGSQAAIDAKGASDRLYIKIIFEGEDLVGRTVSIEFSTTWII